MATMSGIAEAVVRIHAADRPVLFADACILLDVIRAPLRPAELRGCVDAALELLQLITISPPQCVLVVASFVPREWLSHSQSEAESLKSHLAKFDDESERLRGFCTLMGITSPLPRPEFGLLPLAKKLHELSRELLDEALHLNPDHDCIIRAHGRASNYLAPSLKGGEVKDSTIIEECLEVSRRLQADGFARKRVFCTSNRGDYCEAGSRLHPSLAAEFLAAGLGFATTIPWGVSGIKKP